MVKRLMVLLSIFLISFLLTRPVIAQSYYFNLSDFIVDVYVNEDGTASIDYQYYFNNDPSGHPIEYVDVAYPPYVDVILNSISADINGVPLGNISESGYEGEGDGVAIGLEDQAIPPGGSGAVHVNLGTINGLIFQDKQDADYAGINFSPAYFDSSIVNGNTNMTVSIHLPPGVMPEEPRWHEAPRGWMTEPETYLDEQGRVTYTWTNSQAKADQEYQFGASFPKSYLPAGLVRTPDLAQSLETDWATLTNVCLWTSCISFFVILIGISYARGQKRRLQYLSPKISIEGHGIKRGLTAIEAAILLEQPLDKVLTMMLFSVIKKSAATVIKQDPLEIKLADPSPADLQPYETQFVQAFKAPPSSRKRELQEMMVDLVKSVGNKMKGFSRRETVVYYRQIVDNAWKQVESAQTPEIKSAQFSENIEWTMMDRDYDDRTKRVFTGPVYIPTWWGHYDPTYSRPSVGTPLSPSTSGGGFTTPTLPGSAFAASVATGVQNFSRNVVGNITDFTSSVTNKTNPVPVSSSSGSRSGGGRSGGSCACACACASCACACAGGGR